MRWIVRLIVLLVIVVVLAVGALFVVPAERIASLATRQFETATGRALTITGGVRPSLWPVIGARIDGVTLANVAGSDAGPLLSAESVDLGVDLSALVGGSVVVRRFEARSPRIVLERDAQGRGNWMFEGLGSGAPASQEAATRSGVPPIALDQAIIQDATLRYIDHVTGTDITLEGITLELSMPEVGGAARLRVAARRGGQDAQVSVDLGSVADLLSGGVVNIAATATTASASVEFTGRAGLEPLAAEGRLTVEGSRLAPLLAFAGISGPEPLPEGARPLTLGGQVTLAPSGSLHLRDGVLGIGANRLRLALDLTTAGERPNLTGEIAADALDLRAFTTGGAAAPAAAPGWPTTRIDASALGLLDARVALTTAAVQTGFADLDSFRGLLTIDRSRGVLSLTEVRAFEGSLTGEVVANNRSGLSVGGNLQLRNVNLMPMLRQTAGFDRLSGTAAVDLRFLGSGASVDAIMRSLEGQGRIDFGAGEIRGFDLAGMLSNLDPSYVGAGNSTIYTSITGGFTMQNGVLRNEDLRLEAALLGVGGTGTVDLGAQVLDYRVTPEALRNAETGSALRVPLLITGPWSAPRFRLDLEGLAEQRLGEERARLEARAREEVQRLETEARARVEAEVRQRLNLPAAGAQPATGDPAAAPSVEDRARSELLRLLSPGTPEPAAPAGN